MIDIVNHKSVGYQADVSFEYFANSYSLAIDKVSAAVMPDDQVYISYGARSNDQLLQYYGFVEHDNPHDVYVMPPLREWDISALELACGRQFAPGRLAKLDEAGLLGGGGAITSSISAKDTNIDDSETVTNGRGGVVLTNVLGIDPAVMQALRVLVSTDDEWEARGEAIGNFSIENSGGVENERCARLAAKTAVEMELSSKPTTVQDDMELLKRIDTLKRLDSTSREENLAIQFRIEKKKLLQKCIQQLQ
jgi:Rubisco LSMT substrate-binding